MNNLSPRIKIGKAGVFLLIMILTFQACDDSSSSGTNPVYITGTFTYSPISVTKDAEAVNESPKWQDDATGQTVKYTIAPADGGGLPDQITINPDTGTITVTPNGNLLPTSKYTVTATGIGSFSGSRATSVTIAITNKMITGTFTYDNMSTPFGTEAIGNTPTWDNGLTDQEVHYTITPPSGGSITGIEINNVTGVITVTTNAPLQSGNIYTITAAGTGNYGGTLTTTIEITVYNANAAPGSPTSILAIAGIEEVDVSLKAPTDTGYINNDGTPGIITYKVYYDENSGFAIASAVGSVESTELNTTISGLTAGTTYFFKATASNATGDSSPSAETRSTPINKDHTRLTVHLADGSSTKVWTLNSNSDYVYVDGGTFFMGAQDEDANKPNYDTEAKPFESPVHEVTIRSFYISQFEVTQAQYNTVMGENPSHFSGNDNNPIENVSWYDAVIYSNKLSDTESLDKVYTVTRDASNAITGVTADWSKNGYRLPTEAEWEYAARGGKYSKGYKYSGSNLADDVAWYRSNSNSQSQETGSKKANELGLYDMSGNVLEWCWDWYANYSDTNPQTDPTGPANGDTRVLRSGSWDTLVDFIRVSIRDLNKPGDNFSNSRTGFRLVKSAH